MIQINIIEMEEDEGSFTRECLRFEMNLEEYKGEKILAVPRCCTNRKGTTDRRRVNDRVKHREEIEKSQ